MTTITYILPSGNGTRSLEVPDGTSVMLAAVRAGLPGIIGECGGAAMCATCHVYVEAGPVAALTPPTDDEEAMLDDAASPRAPNSRLACQIKVSGALEGLIIRIADIM